MIFYLLICSVSIFAGIGIARTLRLKLEFNWALYLAPVLTLLFWTLCLGIGICFGITVRELRPAIIVGTLIFCVYGVYGRRFSLEWRQIICFGCILLLPVAIMRPYFLGGITAFPGSPVMDGWSYIAFGQYLLDYPKGAHGGLAPLYQYASHLSGTRFCASGMLGLFSIFQHDETQAVSGCFLAYALFVLACASMLFSMVQKIKPSSGVLYVSMCIFSGWTLKLLYANNYDNALFLAILPAVSTIAAISCSERSRSILMGSLLAAGVYIYPEMFPVLVLLALLLTLSPWHSSDIRKGRVVFGAFLCAMLLLLPYFPLVFIFFMGQLAGGMGAFVSKSGDSVLREILHSKVWLVSFWGMFDLYPLPNQEIGSNWMFLARLISVFLTAFSVLGCIRLFGNKQHGLVVFLVILLIGYFYMAYLQSYLYGAYKFGLLAWWLLCFTAIIGAELLADMLKSYGLSHDNMYFLITWSIVCVLTAHNLNYFDRMLTIRSMQPFQQLKYLPRPAKNVPLILAANDTLANEWAVYFLRDRLIYLPFYRGIMSQPQVVPWMKESPNVDLHAARYLLTDNMTPAPAGQKVWGDDVYALWLLPERWAVVAEIDNPNGLDVSGGLAAMWLGKGTTELVLISQYDGAAVLSGNFRFGPSMPESPNRQIVVVNEDGHRSLLQIEKDGEELSFTVPVHFGANRIKLEPIGSPTVEVLPNGDTRPLIVGIWGLRITQ